MPARRSPETAQLFDFANALRETLGLDPLYQGRGDQRSYQETKYLTETYDDSGGKSILEQSWWRR